MGYDLSTGSLRSIMTGNSMVNPIMQILESKLVCSKGTSSSDRYRLHLSDGQYSISFALLSTPDLVGPLEDFSVIKIKKYLISDLKSDANKGGTKILLIMEMEMVAKGSIVGRKLGNPVTVSMETLEKGKTNEVKSEPSFQGATASSSNQSMTESKIISPISSLTPYHNKWTIKARVTSKSEIRTWSNSRGEGKLFNFDLMDESGEIRCTGFKDLVDKFYNYVEADKIYFISKCQLKPANKQFCLLKNDYEMTLNNDSLIEECKENDGIVPQVKYDFVPISEIGSKEAGAVIDVIGVCRDASDVSSFTSKQTNRELRKREVYLVDKSLTEICLTLWGTQADTFDKANYPVIVLKNAKVGEFGGGKNISPLMGAQIKVNPDIPECHRLKGWYETEGKDIKSKNLSQVSSMGNIQTPWMYLQEVQESGITVPEKGIYFQVLGTIMFVNENAIYKACPLPDCNKKLVDHENGTYRCEKCAENVTSFKYRLLMLMNVGDWSGNQWMNVFSTEAEKILGVSSQEVGEAKENKEDGKLLQDANFREFVFKCRTKLETYNDEERLKTVVIKVDDVDYEQVNDALVANIQRMLED